MSTMAVNKSFLVFWVRMILTILPADKESILPLDADGSSLTDKS